MCTLKVTGVKESYYHFFFVDDNDCFDLKFQNVLIMLIKCKLSAEFVRLCAERGKKNEIRIYLFI